ncbi:hypothetical protein RND81_04G125100 [Saponaria officinalis]|uniref:Peptidase A1 domain-containing protein n=1 Tax=Saponaria officinalis TaxID=3572 RepID=A0AAW1LLC3_SAPOF
MDFLKHTQNQIQLKMIHIDSRESLVYDPKLTDFERAKRLITMSESRTRFLANSTRYRENNLTPKMGVQGMTYHVEIGIGEFDNINEPYHKTYLVLDTGSDLVWTQCEGCWGTTLESSALLRNSRSHTYNPFPCNQCPDGQCNQDHYCIRSNTENLR